ncbi:hypothetical protein [Streptomyces tendae]|uniref:hypothetical protein n=1 Tax=Streptomyces tendae TaxID=1932 RepID=UPI003716112D
MVELLRADAAHAVGAHGQAPGFHVVDLGLHGRRGGVSVLREFGASRGGKLLWAECRRDDLP